MIVFLDYDGVLHPDAAYLVKGRPELRAAGTLFMWAPILEEALAPYPDAKIVLSTSWVPVLKSFSRARAFLPAMLQARVIGATWHSAMVRHPEGSTMEQSIVPITVAASSCSKPALLRVFLASRWALAKCLGWSWRRSGSSYARKFRLFWTPLKDSSASRSSSKTSRAPFGVSGVVFGCASRTS